MRVIGINSNDGYLPIFRNNHDEIFYLLDLDANELVICGKDTFVLTKDFDFAVVKDTFSEAYDIREAFVLAQTKGDCLEYSVSIGKFYRKESLIVEY